MSAPRRLHPAGIAVYAVAALREGALPLLALLVAAVAGGGLDSRALLRGAALAAAATLLATLLGVLRWLGTTYWVSPGAIHFRRGLLSVKEIDVPLSRLESLDTVQGPVQRLFGVQALHVQTAGGGAGGEIVLEAIGAGEVAALRALVADRLPEAPEAAGPERALGRRELLVAALTSGQIGVILPVLAGLSQLFDDVLFGRRGGDGASGLLPDTFAEWALAGAALLAVAWLLSVLGAVVAFAGFTVARREDRLRIRRGFGQRREVTLPVGRVRAVRVVEGLLRRPFGLATVRVEVTGHAKEPAAARTLFPLLRRCGRAGLPGAARCPSWPRSSTGSPLRPRDRGGGICSRPPRPGSRPARWPPLSSPAPARGRCSRCCPPRVTAGCAGAPPGGGSRTAAWRCAGARSHARPCSRRRRTASRTRSRRSVLQRRAGLADLEVEFGKATNAGIRHLDEAVARRLWEALAT